MAEQTVLETDLPKNRQLILDKGVKTIQWRKDIFFSTNSAKKIELLLLLLSRFSRVRLCATP